MESIHEGIRKFSCDTCGAKFAKSDHVKRHKETVHEGKKPHMCSVCGKGFTRKDKLNR